MIIDERTQFGNKASLIGDATTHVLGDVVDLGVSRDMGRCSCARLFIGIDTAVLASGGAANVTFKLVSDSVASLDDSPTVHWSSAAIAKGTLVAGYVVVDLALPAGVMYERYLGVTFTPDTNPITTGKANAFIVFCATPGNHPYPAGI